MKGYIGGGEDGLNYAVSIVLFPIFDLVTWSLVVL